MHQLTSGRISYLLQSTSKFMILNPVKSNQLLNMKVAFPRVNGFNDNLHSKNNFQHRISFAPGAEMLIISIENCRDQHKHLILILYLVGGTRSRVASNRSCSCTALLSFVCIKIIDK